MSTSESTLKETLSPTSNGIPKDEGLKRVIGVWGLSANIVNIIVGAGIFVLPAIVAEGLGAAGVLAYLLCGVSVALVMFCFAEVGSKVTVSGGPYAYIEAAFGKYAGFIANWLFLYACVTADAAVINALADVLAAALPVFKQPIVRIPFFAIVFGTLMYINIRGVKQGIGMVKFTTIAKLTPLLLLIVVGWTQVDPANLQWDVTPPLAMIGQISLILFFAFQGAESALTVGGEVRNPNKTIPRSILLGVGGILFLYVAIQTIAQGVLGSSLPTFTDAPLAETGRRIFGQFGFTLLIVGAAISMFGYLTGEILSLPRVVFSAARDRVIPSALLAKVHPKYATPFVAIIVYTIADFILAAGGGFKQLAILSSAAILLIYLGVVLAAVKVRMDNKYPGVTSFKVPGGYVIQGVAALIIIWLLYHLTKNELIGLVVFVGAISIAYFAIQAIRQQKKVS
jgi:amino acid transporter